MRSRAVVALAIAIAVPVLMLITPSLTHSRASGSGSPRCTTQVRSRAQLLAAVRHPLAGSPVVCVHAGSYGDITFYGRYPGLLTVMAYPHERPVLGRVDLHGVSNLRIQGFDMPHGGFDTDQTNVHNVQIVANTIHDCFCQALRLWDGASDILFERNYVHDIHYNGNWQTGWGIKADGGKGVQVRYNTLSKLEDDAMEIGAAADWQIIGNIVTGIHNNPSLPSAHADALMLWAGDRNFTVRDNRFVDSTDVLVSGSTSDVTFENNLIARMVQLCVDGGPTGTSAEGVVRYTWIDNTIYDCGSAWNGGGRGGRYGLVLKGPATAGASNVVKCNIVADLEVDTHAQFAHEDYNVSAHGPRSGPHDVRVQPRFRDRWSYQPTNLRFDAGYRLAAAGSPLAPGSIRSTPRLHEQPGVRALCHAR